MTMEIYTDGACKGNPGRGGWGAFMTYYGDVRELVGGELETTNNRMELTAAIKALDSINPNICKLYSDSKYLIDGMNIWLPKWKANKWRTSTNQPVKNLDLWQELDKLNNYHIVTWLWVKGHEGNQYNERADTLARQGVPNESELP